MTTLTKALGLAAGLAIATGGIASAQSEDLVAAATEEGAVAIYTSTDLSQAQALIEAFSAKYPGIRVDYNDLGTNGAYNRVISEAGAGQVSGDLIWSSAMDLQMKLAADGYLQASELPEDLASALPDWANYENMLFATTIEPVGAIYNTLALSEEEVPQTRDELIEFLRNDKYQGKVAAYDPEKSGSGFLFFTNDLSQTDNFWEVAEAFGEAGGKTYSSTGAMRETVVSGENVLAFNLIGSYALDWVKETQNLGVVFDEEYTAAFSRLAGIIDGAPHPNAAKLFLTFMLSKEGQSTLAANGLPSVRTDVETGLNIKTLNDRVGGSLKPIAVDESLLEYMDPTKRVEFLRKWSEATKG